MEASVTGAEEQRGEEQEKQQKAKYVCVCALWKGCSAHGPLGQKATPGELSLIFVNKVVLAYSHTRLFGLSMTDFTRQNQVEQLQYRPYRQQSMK